MEHMEASEEFDTNKKTTTVATSKGKKKSNESSGSKESHCCMLLHSNNNAHDTSKCKTIQAKAKKLKGNNSGSNKTSESHNKSWKNKAKNDADNSKKELATLVKKATQLIKQQKLNVIESEKKIEPVKCPSKEEEKQEEQELCAFDAKLKDFNYGDLDKLDLKEESHEEKEDGEMDISISDEVSDEVSV